ncbi:ZIP family metal transporter [Candidatus Nanosalina sp. VS9-1]|uniref:ZIP family metal transporter n=1 Tax=Candidatus Nanosalina sp. VS9-1 TaxID=3388566 RepID=UPI0039E162E6
MESGLLLGSLILTSVLSGLGALFLGLSEERMHKLTPYLISLSAGTIFGGVFIHLVFKLANNIGYTRQTGLIVLLGMAGSLILERAVHWHCHNQDHHIEAFSYVLVAGDAVHNILDGILVASSFLAGVPAGLAATIAVIAHKVPKEAGDFGVLVHSGFSRNKAVLFNIGISVFMFMGAGLVLGLSTAVAGINTFLLPLVIGNFVYIAGADLLPRFKEDEGIGLHLAMFSLGVAVMYAIPYLRQLVLV